MLKADWSAQHPRRPGSGSTAGALAQLADSPDKSRHAATHFGHTGCYHSSTEYPGHWGLMTGPEHCRAPVGGAGNNGARNHVTPFSLLNTAGKGRNYAYGPC